MIQPAIYEGREVWSYRIYFNRDTRKEELAMVFKPLGGGGFSKEQSFDSGKLRLSKTSFSKQVALIFNITEMHVEGPGNVNCEKQMILHGALQNTAFSITVTSKVTGGRWLVCSIPLELPGLQTGDRISRVL